MKHITLVFVLFFLFFGTGLAQEEEWTQEKFTDLVTFVYNYGEVIKLHTGTDFYSITLEVDEFLVAHLGFIPEELRVILTVEAFDFDDDGNRVVDHNFYEHYFCEETGMYYPFPNTISGNIVVLDEQSILLDLITKITREFVAEGYKNKEWEYWINKFYEHMQEVVAKGVSI